MNCKGFIHSLLSLILALSLYSCSEEKNIKDEKLIESSIFIEILVEAQLIESTEQFVRDKNKNFSAEKSYIFLFNKYKVTEEEFEYSLEFYSRNPDDLEKLYDEVIVKLTEKQSESVKPL